MSFICNFKGCTEEFEDHAAYKEHLAEHERGMILANAVGTSTDAPLGKVPPTATGKQVSELQKVVEQRKKEGVQLEYRYKGYCEQCGAEVETLLLEEVLEDKTKLIVVAWCPKDKKKLAQRQVIKL